MEVDMREDALKICEAYTRGEIPRHLAAANLSQIVTNPGTLLGALDRQPRRVRHVLDSVIGSRSQTETAA